MALRLGPALLIVVVFVSLMIGVILHGISINELEYRSPPASHFKSDVIIDNQLDNNLMWFLQVTDLHISSRGSHQRELDFIEFCQNHINIFKPDAVLVTGDITDGIKPNSTLSTGPQSAEWLAYSKAVAKADLTQTKWFDIRGNHDNFNVFRPQDPNTLYRKYSIMGKNHSRNYMGVVEKGDKKYTFIGVDEVQTPGLKIPFNFIGIVKDEDMSELKKFKQNAKDMNSEYTTWFAHYPTSCLASPNEGLRNIIDGPYLCGHYHTIGNLVSQMHATQQPGYAELELGDWKYNRRIRLASVDHQLFNFVDFGFREFPVALMTTPKKPQYSMPKYEPIERIKNSTHIRVLAFTNATKINTVEISIDGGARQQLTNSRGPLWVVPWLPQNYETGLHTIDIYVEDSSGQRRSYQQDFSMDSSKREFSLGALILLRAYFRTNVMAIFYFIVSACTLPLLILRLISYRQNGDMGLRRHYRGTLLYNVHLLSNIKRIQLPLFIIPIWLAIGPHFIGHLVDEAIGACFVWGILIDGTFIHTGITYNVGSLFLLLIHAPEVILLTYQVSSSYKSILHTNTPASLINLRMLIHITVVTTLQLLMGWLLYSAYGTMSFLTSFQYLWCIFIYAYCWYQCSTIDRSDFACFERTESTNEQQPLTSQRSRDDKTPEQSNGC